MGYDPDFGIQVRKVATGTGIQEQAVYGLIEGEWKTRNKHLAKMVAEVTGEPMASYLTLLPAPHAVAEGVRIDHLPHQDVGYTESYDIIKTREEPNLLDLTYAELCDFHRELMFLLADVKYAMHGKCGRHTQKEKAQ